MLVSVVEMTPISESLVWGWRSMEGDGLFKTLGKMSALYARICKK